MMKITNEELFAKADSYRRAIKANRPPQTEEIRQLDHYFKVGLTYSSNALSGNTLTLSDTKVLLEDGLTVGAKPLKDSLEAVGHARAYDFMLRIARQKELVIDADVIRNIHRLFYVGIDDEEAGAYRKLQAYINGTHCLPPPPEEIPDLMRACVQRVNDASFTLHPIALAALAHKWLADIHPFKDGNGRTARLLMNLILINRGYGIVTIPPILRQAYISALRISQREIDPDIAPFIRLIAECAIETGKAYCRLLRIHEYQEEKMAE